ncbi:MAG: PepSY1/2 domain-containing protein [Lysinibacillus sp.]
MKNTIYLFGILLVALLVYTIDLNQENKKLRQTMHAYYTNELAMTSEKISELSTAINQAQLFSPGKARDEEMDTVWRVSNELRNTISQLPIQSEIANSMLNYLGRMGEQAKKGREEDWSAIATNMNALKEEWNVATARFFSVDSNYDTWNDGLLEMADSPFKNVATNLKSYHETDFPITASESDYQKKRDLAHLTDREITKDEALQKMHNLFPATNGATLNVALNADDAAYPFYHIQFVRGSRLGYADITKKGGHVLSFLLERPVNEVVITQQQAREMATKFLQDAGYTDVVYVEARENHEAWHFVFTRQEGDALVYPDSIQLKLAKDTGEILGLNAMEYIQKETLPVMTPKEIVFEDYFADSANVEDTKLVYTENDSFDLVLCYEVIVRMNNDYHDTFRVLINAETHEVVEVEPLT